MNTPIKNKRTLLLILALTLYSVLTARAQVVYADYSDPDVCEGADGDYWLTASSFQCTPGLPILHSTDLVHWELVNYALERLEPVEHYNGVQHGCGVWAPSIRRHGDTYYIYWGDPDYGVFMVKTTDPRGRWSEPVLVMEGKGVIDTCPLWDEDGRCYLVNGWANSRCGFNAVLTVRELSADGTRAIGKPVLVYDGQVDGNHTIEGPKFYKKDGYYYILAPAGGVETGWQVALRSKQVYGPYESKTVFNQEGIHQGGLAGDHFVCFQERGAFGRILHLLDVTWQKGWPMMKLSRDDRPQGALKVASEELLYQWHANYQDAFGFPLNGGVRVYGHSMPADYKNLWEVPNLYLKKMDGVSKDGCSWGTSKGKVLTDTLRMTITARAKGQQSGFVVMGRDYCRLSADFDGKDFILKWVVCKDADKDREEVVKTLATPKTRKYGSGAKTCYECHLCVSVQYDERGLCRFSYSEDGKRFTTLDDDFQAREGKWIGAKYGVFSLAPEGVSKGWVDLIWGDR